MSEDRQKPVVLVTGGAQGIGLGITRHLLLNGWRVALLDLDEEALLALDDEPHADARLAIAADVSREAEVVAAVQRVLDQWGRLDAVINNAGIANPVSGPLAKLELDQWQRWLNVNLTGAMLVCKHSIDALRRRRGAIVNIASTRALQSEPDCEAYAASKGGLVAFTHALAVSLAGDVRVNAISPGWIAVDDFKKPAQRQPLSLRPEDHEQHPVGRVGRPLDIAALCAFLIGPEAGFITGQNLVVDGGMTRKMIYRD